MHITQQFNVHNSQPNYGIAVYGMSVRVPLLQAARQISATDLTIVPPSNALSAIQLR